MTWSCDSHQMYGHVLHIHGVLCVASLTIDRTGSLADARADKDRQL